MWQEKLKQAGVNIHVIATGAGAGLQQQLWQVPGSSAYLSGCSFPYAPEEQEELLGFMPEHFCSEEAAVDLACAAYMKAYKFGGKKPVGVGLTASVASEKIHRGDHRIFICVVTDDKISLFSHLLDKGVGSFKRKDDGIKADMLGLFMLTESIEIFAASDPKIIYITDATEMARARFFAHPFFAANGKRLATLPKNDNYALMSGAFNPPHDGHFGLAQEVLKNRNHRVVFEITTEPPHKDPLSVQDMLKRAKNLQGHDRFFTRKLALYLDKAKAFPGVPLVMGADAAVRLFDPKWGVSIVDLVRQFDELGTIFYVAGREVNGKFIVCDDIIESIQDQLSFTQLKMAIDMMHDIPGRWDISSTELRNKK
jgi:hypothetical protein